MHDLARPKLAPAAGRAGVAAWAWRKRKNPSKPTPSRPSPPAQSMSRRVRPSHNVFGEPKTRNMPQLLETISQSRWYPFRLVSRKEIMDAFPCPPPSSADNDGE